MSQHPDFRAVVVLANAGKASLRMFDPADLCPQDDKRWDDLGHDKSGDNVFSEPWLMRISLAHCDARRRAVLAVVVDDAGKWIGAVPLRRSAWHGRAIWPNWSGWHHPNQFNGTPLVRAGQEERFWRSLLTGLDREPGQSLCLCLHDLPADDPVNRALVRVCREDRRSWLAHRRYSRACLHADLELAERAERGVKSKLRRRLDSLERQLADEHGPVSFRMTRNPAEIGALVEQFLELEASGWKGATGSALEQAPATRAFFLAATTAAAARGRFEVSWLEVAGKCLAMTTQFVGADWSCGFKRAHDERFARFAPGQLHLKHLTRQLCAEARSSFDSSAAPSQDSLNRLWPDRRELFDCRIAIGGGLHRFAFRALSALQRGYHAAKRMR